MQTLHQGAESDDRITAHALMVQGTTSNAGKSLLVTALCRWLAGQDVSVAPFKPQNMALNSAVIVEGAGSPAEINLRDDDIANMGFAESVDCPVILIADIDLGGVFAHLFGTLALLAESERERIKGFVINRFRGDLNILKPGLDWLEEKTSKPVLGVLPFLSGLHLDAEDSLSRQQGSKPAGDAERIRVIVPAFPRISNHTDFDPLALHPQVDLRFIGPDEVIPPADLIVLPGTKSVRPDLAWLRNHGWEASIQRHLRYGGKLIGICGGFKPKNSSWTALRVRSAWCLARRSESE